LPLAIATSQYVILFKILWWLFRGCSPLPIPNREVKPLMADGTALQCGRVGSCHIYLSPNVYVGVFFVLYFFRIEFGIEGCCSNELIVSVKRYLKMLFHVISKNERLMIMLLAAINYTYS
jgi:hypothetical protein